MISICFAAPVFRRSDLCSIEHKDALRTSCYNLTLQWDVKSGNYELWGNLHKCLIRKCVAISLLVCVSYPQRKENQIDYHISQCVSLYILSHNAFGSFFQKICATPINVTARYS